MAAKINGKSAKRRAATRAELSAQLHAANEEVGRQMSLVADLTRERAAIERRVLELETERDQLRAQKQMIQVALGYGVRLNSMPARGELAVQVQTAQALGQLVLVRLLEIEGKSEPALELFAHENLYNLTN